MTAHLGGGLSGLPHYMLLTGAQIMERIEPEFLSILLRLFGMGHEVQVRSGFLDEVREYRRRVAAGEPAPPLQGSPEQRQDGLNRLLKSFEKHGMPISAAHAQRALRTFTGDIPSNEWVAELKHRIDDDFLYSLVLMRLPSEKAKLWEVRAPFGEAAFGRFEHARFDATEAGNCYATGRNTACVFHLMRVMEHALRALAATLSIDDPGSGPDRSWGAILKAIQTKIDAIADERKGWKQREGAFFQGAHGLLVGVKDAWRNDCMHLEAKYDESDAKRIYDAVNGFMGHLAQLPERA